MFATLLCGYLMAATTWPAPADLPAKPGRPDVLAMFDGTKVSTKEEWLTKRKPELKELFQHYMYGRRPADPTNFAAKVLHEDTNAFGGAGVLREIELTFDVNGVKNPTPIRLLLVTPKGGPPAACFVGMNFQGNYALVTDPKVRLPDVWMYPKYPEVKDNKATEAGRGKVLDVWPFEMAIKRGYAIATFYSGDIQPDRPNVSEGLRAVLAPKEPHDTACIVSWAWGVSRAVDYLVTDPAIDAKRIAVVGHSRLGKTAIVAAAFDDRIAMAIPHQAGCGGTGPSKHSDTKAESVKRITTNFPHWFCGNFAQFRDDLDKLPFDQHALMALVAPRPMLVMNAEEDLWANPSGQFENLKAASPVYEMLGVEGLKADKMPEFGQVIDSRLGYYIRKGKHSMTFADWEVYLKFADRWLK